MHRRETNLWPIRISKPPLRNTLLFLWLLFRGIQSVGLPHCVVWVHLVNRFPPVIIVLKLCSRLLHKFLKPLKALGSLFLLAVVDLPPICILFTNFHSFIHIHLFQGNLCLVVSHLHVVAFWVMALAHSLCSESHRRLIKDWGSLVN